MRLLSILLIMRICCFAYSSSDTSTRICEPIKIELCKGIGYNETSLPINEMQTDVDLTLQTFAPLISYGCSNQLNFFLCAAYLPMCTPKVNSMIGPCRGLCEAVRARCLPVLSSFGFKWPATLDCNNFPKENNHENMCMEGPGETVTNNYLPVPKQPPQSSCKYLYKSNLYVRLNRSNSRCISLCEADVLWNAKEKQLAYFWIGAWSIASLFTCIIALLCLILTDTNLELLPLVVCHCLICVGFGIRILAGRNSSSCGYDPQLPGVSLLLTDGLTTSPCSSTFLFRYYFGMAATIWVSILCYRWNFELRQYFKEVMGTNALKKNPNHNTFLQIIIWGLPAIQTIIALITKLIDADELLGMCYVGNQSDRALLSLVAIPLLIYWTIGCGYLLTGYLSKKSFKNIQVPAHINSLGAFVLIYNIINAILLLSMFYQFGSRETWLQIADNQSQQAKAPLWLYILHPFLELLLGVLASSWACIPKLRNGCCNSEPVKQIPAYKQPQQHIKYPQAKSYIGASYQTVCPPNSCASSSMISMSTLTKNTTRSTKYSPYATSQSCYHSQHGRRTRSTYRMTSLHQSGPIIGSETVL